MALTSTLESELLASVELHYDTADLAWRQPDRSVGETAGFWEGYPTCTGATLGGRVTLTVEQAAGLLVLMGEADDLETAHREIRLRGMDAASAHPSPDECNADLRADERSEGWAA